MEVAGLSRESVRRREYGPGVRGRADMGYFAVFLSVSTPTLVGSIYHCPRSLCLIALQELAHYALATTDLEFAFPFGWDEMWGIANRGDFDLRAHSRASGHDLVYRDPVTQKVR